MTVLTLYGSSVASVTLSTANKLSTTTGGAETSTVTTAPTGASLYMEALSQGGSGTTNASIPAPSGKGWLLDATTLEGQTIAAGNWSGIYNFIDNAGGGWSLTSITLLFYKRSSGGVYTSIGSIALGSTAVTGAKQQVSFAATSMSAVSFATGDKLYIELFYQSGTSTNAWSSDTMAAYVSNSGTAGVANDLQITTPGYSAGSTTVDKKVVSRFYQYALAPKKFLTRFFQFTQAPKKVASRFYQRSQVSKKVVGRLYQYVKTSKASNSRVFQYLMSARKYSSRLYQYATNSRKIVSRVSQFVRSTKKTTTRFSQSNQVIKKWASRFSQFGNQSRVLATRFSHVLYLTVHKTIVSRFSQWSQSPKQTATRLLHSISTHKNVVVRLFQYSQALKKISVRLSQWSQSPKKAVTRLFHIAKQDRKMMSRLCQTAIRDRATASRFLQRAQIQKQMTIRFFQNARQSRKLISRFSQKAQNQKSVVTRLFQTDAFGNISIPAGPSLYYTMNGIILDVPIIANQPSIQGGTIPQGSCFTLAWFYPSAATQTAMSDGSTGLAQFLCDGSLITAPVFVRSSTVNGILIATVTVTTIMVISKKVIQTQFY